MFKGGIERADCLVHLREDVQYTSDDGIFMKGMIMNKAGTIVGQHAHEYAHTSLLARGRVRVFEGDTDDFGVDFFAPAFIPIAAKVKHKFVALDDDTHIYCIHNMSDYHMISDKPLIHEEHRFQEAS